jgi:hypothetical protein
LRHLSFIGALLLFGCGGTTGSALISFTAIGGGPSDAVAGSPMSFQTGIGFHVVLTRARLHVGAVYLNDTVPSSGSAELSCIRNQGIYVAEAFGPLDLDLLSPQLSPFPSTGEGTQTPAKTAEVWLTSGDINAATDPTIILDVAGTADRSGAVYPFVATVTIGSNRLIPVENPALPGSNPICRQRIVTPIVVDFLPTDGGSLELRVDPRGMFNVVDFSTLHRISDNPVLYEIPDSSAGAGGALFRGLLSNAGVYRFSWSG